MQSTWTTILLTCHERNSPKAASIKSSRWPVTSSLTSHTRVIHTPIMPHRTQTALNTLYIAFFLVHIPIIFIVDITPLYPPSLTPDFLLQIRHWYHATYKDRFFASASGVEGDMSRGMGMGVTGVPSWFCMFLWMEGLLHVPICIYGLRKFWREGGEFCLFFAFPNYLRDLLYFHRLLSYICKIISLFTAWHMSIFVASLDCKPIGQAHRILIAWLGTFVHTPLPKLKLVCFRTPIANLQIASPPCPAKPSS